MKTTLKNIRDALAYGFSWLVICVLAASLLRGGETLRVSFLWKLLAMCLWGAICFSLCFQNQKMQKKGFQFSLTCFYALFIPAEIGLFYWMGIFQGKGSAAVWIGFFVIIAALYLISLVIDGRMRKKAALYSRKLKEYQKQARK